MAWKERWEDFKESLLHVGTDREETKEEETREEIHERREEALHRNYRTLGSETLDD